MDEPTRNPRTYVDCRPNDESTHLMGHAGPLRPPDPGTQVFAPVPSGPPPEWPRPVWRRRGALIGAGLLVLVIAGLVVGIVLSAPGSPPAPANAAATLPATSTAPAAKGTGRKGQKLGPGERLVAGTINTITNDQVTVTPVKGGNPVTVTTDGTTRFAGTATSITDLRPGERVQMIVRNGTAVTIRARSQASGG